MKIFIGRGINDTNLIQLNILSLYTYAYLYKCTENLRLYSPDYLRVSKEFDWRTKNKSHLHETNWKLSFPDCVSAQHNNFCGW